MRRLFVLAVLAALITACGGDSGEVPDQQPSSTTVPETTSTPTTVTPTTTQPPKTSTTAAESVTTGSTAPGTSSTSTTSTTTTSTTTTTTTIPPPPLPASPLTGLGVEDPELLDRRTMAVKVDNISEARPQAGIGEAEAVFELLVESGITRFIALFHTVDSSTVGPVRSVRPTDPHLLRHFNATMLTSGGQDWVLARFPRNGVGVIGEIGIGGFRDNTRSAPHNYYVNTAEFRPVADERLYPNTGPPPLFEFGDLPSEGVLGAVYEVNMEWAPGNLITWRWNGLEWERHLPDGPHLWTSAESPEQIITADTLVVIFSDLFYTRPPSGGGYALPTMNTTGEGRVLIFAEGQVVEGKWERAETTHQFVFSTEDGAPITVPPGRPWLSLFPEGRPVTW